MAVLPGGDRRHRHWKLSVSLWRLGMAPMLRNCPVLLNRTKDGPIKPLLPEKAL